MRKKAISLSILLIFLILTACQNNTSNDIKDTDDLAKLNLSDFKSGAILVYSDKLENNNSVKSQFDEITTKYNISNIQINVDNKKDKEALDSYLSTNEKQIADNEKLENYNQKLNTLKENESIVKFKEEIQGLFNKYGENNIKNNLVEEDIYTQYQNLLKNIDNEYQSIHTNIIKVVNESLSSIIAKKQNNSSISEEQKNDILSSLKGIENNQGLTINELYDYIDVQSNLTSSQTNKLVINQTPTDFPSIYIVYEGQVVNLFSPKDDKLPMDLLNSNPDSFKEYLTYNVGLINFQSSTEMSNVINKIKNKDSFVVYYHGNSCVHCKKMNPILDDILTTNQFSIDKVDMYLMDNQKVFNYESKNYNLNPIESTPTFVAYKDGAEVERLTSSSWAIPNEKSDLGYDINAEVIEKFLKKYYK